MNLREAERLAEDLVGWLAPACAAVCAVGSVRRRRPEVKDVELALLPAMQADLFGGERPAPHLLDGALRELIASRRLAWHPEKPADGPRQKRLWVPALRAQVELWIADGRENWGNTLVIRTGSADFGHWLVTPRAHGGAMPAGMHHAGGYLWRGGERLSCPDEAAFFRALGIGEVPPPETRDLELARRLARGMRP